MTESAGPRILIVDDDAEMRAYLRACLAPVASTVLEAEDGVRALELLGAPDTPPVALVIADVVMPRMDGIALRDAIRGDPSLEHLPVLLVTGEAGPERAGSSPVLMKPFNGRLLRTYVRELCARDRGV